MFIFRLLAAHFDGLILDAFKQLFSVYVRLDWLLTYMTQPIS